MACVVAPMAEAIVIMAVKKIVERNELKALTDGIKPIKSNGTLETGISWSRKLSWLANLLWGGVLLLALEHLWHGKIVPWAPFLTAMSNPENIVPMLHEIATVGTSMALFVTLVWGIMVFVADQKTKHDHAVAQKAV